jgi:putative ABC transport system permease protein
VMGQVLTESLVMALLAGVAGIFVAYATTVGMVVLLPRGSEDFFTTQISPKSAGFALGVSVVTGFLFGLFPAMHSTRMDLAGAMKDQAGNLSSTGGAKQFRRVLVTAQIALSLVLLVSAGMFLKSLVNVLNIKLGLRTENLISFGLSPELNQYSPERTRAFFEQLEARLAAIPGVDGASVSMVSLISGNNWGSNVSVDGFQAGPDTDTHSMYNEVGPGFFKLMKVPMMEGREFQASDSATGPKVAIVNQAFVRKFGNGKSLLGKRMQMGSGGKNDVEIVGVVKDVKYSDVKDAAPALFYTPYRQDPKLGGAEVYVGSATGVAAVLPEVRRVVAELDPNLPMENVRSMEAQVKENIVLDRFVSTLAAAFAALATLLAAVGLYGVLSYTVARRTREIGIRLAIGADAPEIRNMVMREVSWMVLIGVVVGLPASYGLMRFAESLLYELKSGDIAVMAAAVVMIAIVALGAGYAPARRAMQVEPLEALRYE